MAHSLSAQKRVRQSAKKNRINHSRKNQIKSQIKALEEAVEKGDSDAAEAQLKDIYKSLDKVSSTSTMHKKTAARKKSRLTSKVNALKKQ